MAEVAHRLPSREGMLVGGAASWLDAGEVVCVSLHAACTYRLVLIETYSERHRVFILRTLKLWNKDRLSSNRICRQSAACIKGAKGGRGAKGSWGACGW